VAAASPHPTRRRPPGLLCRFVLYCALQAGRFASSNPPQREEVKSMLHLKSRLVRVAWSLASLAALAAALGAGNKWI
jgi:hypothetical protein